MQKGEIPMRDPESRVEIEHTPSVRHGVLASVCGHQRSGQVTAAQQVQRIILQRTSGTAARVRVPSIE
jgi:hypothetical protein